MTVALTQTIPVRVYYEDTDMGGVVYYANYLRFAERGRTEFIRSFGVNQRGMTDDKGRLAGFVVSRADIAYRRPARLDDMLTVETTLTAVGAASAEMAQRVLRGSEELVTISVRLGCISFEDGSVARMPRALHDAMARLLAAAPQT